MGDRKRVMLTTTQASFLAAAGGLACVAFVMRHRIIEKLRYAYDFRNPLRHKRIEIIETVDECRRVVNTLQIHCNAYKVLGFDCEWVTVGGSRRPVALLQLSSHEGLCALFRLCTMQQIPKSLRDLLEDDEVIKVGVGPHDDARKLSLDYGVDVASTFDLRFLAAITGEKCEGLGKMSKSLLGLTLDKNWRLACSDWEATMLSDKQLHYAANDALVAVEIFKKLCGKLEPKRYWNFSSRNFESLQHRLEPFLDIAFKTSYLSRLNASKPLPERTNKKSTNWQAKKMQTRSLSTCAKVFYDNCLLEAPDGELLCTIDRRKAQWYIDRQLGVEVEAVPFCVRLNFEPAGRGVGEVGRYYQAPKENRCVVCGRRDAYLRKNVVPREYRKHFPDVMKSHTSHDVLLLCPHCHQISNISDLKIRTKLAQQCGAPLEGEKGTAKCIEVPVLKNIRSAARALLYSGEKIPPERREVLKAVIMEHYAESTLENDISEHILKEAANINTTMDNENYFQHGEKVVESYQRDHGGLIELERVWREHFLNTMQPIYLPTHWNVNHNANRLKIRAQEGRVDTKDLLLAGLQTMSSDKGSDTTSPIPPKTEEITI